MNRTQRSGVVIRILFTGASAFTGYWFVRELRKRGHEVIAPIRRAASDYEGVRARRVREVMDLAEVRSGVQFGSDRFIELVREFGGLDVFCHHAAEATNYRSPEFDPVAAASANTKNIRVVLDALLKAGCRRVVLTGSVFEPDEGAGSLPLRAFSPYGLSKGLTHHIFSYYAQATGIALDKFVIANPFGPLEEPKFTAYLARCWLAGEVAAVSAPRYVRDNIPVDLLASCYGAFVETSPSGVGAFRRHGPSYYAETNAAFAMRMSHELKGRLGMACDLRFSDQLEFAEPASRINTDPVDTNLLGWSEAGFWDALCEYYRAAPGVRPA